jgi:L-alanine-DL-glutamate epimerase-like enolase superfamily enzyme
MKIERVEVRVIGPEVQQFTWFEGQPPQYMTNTVVRIFTDEGVEGVGGVTNYTSFDFDRYTAETMRHMIPLLVGADPDDIEGIWSRLWTRVFPLSPQALGAIDVALWDLRGKAAGQPVHRLLGGTRDTIPAYASTPLLPDVDAYLRFVDEMIEQGFRAVKFHAWCVLEKDTELAKAVRKAHPDPSITFMFDAENLYDRQSALALARELAEQQFTWLEAPLPDMDLEGYRWLTERSEVDIVPAGNWIVDLPAFERAIETRCWSRSRTDVTLAGGITGAKRFMAASEKAGLDCEVLSWGNTLVAAANLHLMLGSAGCNWFEQAVPYPSYEYGMIDAIRTAPDGRVHARPEPGFGFSVDWEAMERATVHRLDSRELL